MMVYLSVWLRRSNVMTGAEWITTRFGSDAGAKQSHLIVVVFATIGFDISSTRLGLSFGKMFPNLNHVTSILYDHLLLTAILMLAGIALLYIGTRRLSRIE
jgi:hypothetical protein